MHHKLKDESDKYEEQFEKKYQVYVSSKIGEIYVYMVQQQQQEEPTLTAEATVARSIKEEDL